MNACNDCLKKLSQNPMPEYAFFGRGKILLIFNLVNKYKFNNAIKIKKVFTFNQTGTFVGLPVMPIENAASFQGNIIIGSILGANYIASALKEEGLKEEQIIFL